MCHYQVETSTSCGVRSVCAHSGLELAVDTDRYARRIPYFAERAVPIVVEQGIRHGVVSNENVLPPITVVIKCHHSEPTCWLLRKPGTFANVSKSSVPIVVIKGWEFTVVHVRMTVAPEMRTSTATVKISLWRPVHIVRDDKIQLPIVVVVKPSGA